MRKHELRATPQTQITPIRSRSWQAHVRCIGAFHGPHMTYGDSGNRRFSNSSALSPAPSVAPRFECHHPSRCGQRPQPPLPSASRSSSIEFHHFSKPLNPSSPIPAEAPVLPSTKLVEHEGTDHLKGGGVGPVIYHEIPESETFLAEPVHLRLHEDALSRGVAQ